MRIIFDGYWWVEGPISNRLVQRELIKAWAQRFPDDELGLVVPRGNRDAAVAGIADMEGLGARVQVFGARLRPHAVSVALEYPLLARKFRPDVTITHNFAPLLGRSAVFMHDVLERSNPEWFTRAELLYYRAKPVLAPRADIVFSSSKNEAERIRRYNRRIRKVIPIGLAVGTDLLEAIPCRPEALDPAVPTFLLCVARLNVRKNLAVAVEAAIASGGLTPQCPLVIVGEEEGKVGVLSGEVRRAIADGQVRLITRVSDAELVWLYQHARLFLFPSLDEGFGLPPIEALHFGCPVVAADIPVLRETLSGLADFAAPTDVDAFAAAIRTALARPVERVTVPPGRFTTWQQSVETMRAALTA